MQTFVVLYTTPQQSCMAPPFATLYDAKNASYAEKSCERENPTATVVGVYKGSSIDHAYDEYYETYLDE